MLQSVACSVGAGKTVAGRAAIAGLDAARHTAIYLPPPAAPLKAGRSDVRWASGHARPTIADDGVLVVAEDAVARVAVRRDRLARRRKALGLTQEDLAGLLHVERSTVFRREHGEIFFRGSQVTEAEQLMFSPDGAGEKTQIILLGTREADHFGLSAQFQRQSPLKT